MIQYRNYICPDCLRTFVGRRDLMKHMGAKHSTSIDLRKLRAEDQRENHESEADRIIDRRLFGRWS